MKNESLNALRSALIFLWLGFFTAISFFEAPLKFQALGISLVQGLSIGRLIFAQLNHLEWAFLLLITATCFFYSPKAVVVYLLLCVGVLLALESFWLLPFLDKRAVKIIAGENLAPTALHFFYIGFDVLKAIILILMGIKNSSLPKKL